MDLSPDHADAAPVEQGAWSPLECLRLLGRAARAAAGSTAPAPVEFRGFCIVTAVQDGAYTARITHHLDKALCLPWQVRRQIAAARFASAEEAEQHARFLIASRALNFL